MRDFHRIFGFAFGGIIVVVFGAILAVTLANGRLAPGSYKFHYLVLLTALGLATIASTWLRRHRLAYALVLFVVLDVSFGLITQRMSKAGLGRSFLPGNERESRFVWHPTLQVVPRPNYRDRNYAHDARGRRRSAPLREAVPAVLAIGGSTTYDMGVNEGETWAERLEQALGGRADVLNLGVPGYSTAEHVIHAAFYLRSEPRARCALYYVGWNDLRNSFLPKLDPGYADFHLVSQVDNLNARPLSPLAVTSIGALADRLLHLAFDTIPVAPKYPRELAKSGVDERLLAIYLDNLGKIAVLNREAGVTPIFVTQILNAPKFAGEGYYGWFPLVRDRDIVDLQKRFNSALVESGARKGWNVLDPDWRQFDDADFVDNGHFSVRGAQKFAALLAEPVARLCFPR
jgi:hypothetical protein